MHESYVHEERDIAAANVRDAFMKDSDGKSSVKAHENNKGEQILRGI